MTFSHQFENLLARLQVQVPRRLVGEKEDRLSQQRARDRDALLLASRKLVWVMMHPFRQPELIEQICCRVQRHAPGGSSNPGRHRHVLDGGELGQQMMELKDESDVAVAEPRELVRAHAGQLVLPDTNRSRVGAVEPPEQVEQRRLADPGGADDRQDLPPLDPQVELTEDLDRHGRVAVALGKTVAVRKLIRARL